MHDGIVLIHHVSCQSAIKGHGIRYVMVYAYGGYSLRDVALTTSDIEFSVQFKERNGKEKVMHYQMPQDDTYYNRGKVKYKIHLMRCLGMIVLGNIYIPFCLKLDSNGNVVKSIETRNRWISDILDSKLTFLKDGMISQFPQW